MSQEENIIWDKLTESAKATIWSNAKTTHKPSTHVKFHDVTIGDLIKASYHKFYFVDTPNGPSNNYIIDRNHHTDNYGDTPIILTNLSNINKSSSTNIRKLLSNPNPYSTPGMK